MNDRTLLSITTLLVLAGCAGTSTGNPFDGDDGIHNAGGEGAFAQCDSVATVLDDPSAMTALGFAPEQALALLEGTHESSLRWLPSQYGYGPESGDSQISISLHHKGGEIRFIDRSPRSSGDGHEGPAIEPAIGFGPGGPDEQCPDSLEIDVAIALQTGGGALDEQLTGVVQTRDGTTLTLGGELALDDLTGSFSLELNEDPEFVTTPHADWHTAISALGMRGELNLWVERTSRTCADNPQDPTCAVSASSSPPIARWPADDGCQQSELHFEGPAFQVELDTPVQGVRGQELIDLVERTALSIDLGGDRRSALSLEFSADAVCAVSGDGQQLSLLGTLETRSADGRLHASFPASLQGDLAQGQLGEVRLQHLTGDQLTAADIDARIDGLDLSGYDGAFWSFNGRFTAQPEATHASGTLEVDAITEPDCPAPAEQPGDGSMAGSTPGCPGISQTNLLTAPWGTEG